MEMMPRRKKLETCKRNSKDFLEPGDILIYQGIRNEHWREPLQENDCIQVFLHYNTAKSKNNNMYDGRPCLALPDWFKGK